MVLREKWVHKGGKAECVWSLGDLLMYIPYSLVKLMEVYNSPILAPLGMKFGPSQEISKYDMLRVLTDYKGNMELMVEEGSLAMTL